MICKELDKDFNNETDMFRALQANKSLIIDQKKANVLKSYDKHVGVPLGKKLLRIETLKNVQIDDDHEFIVVNTTNILDSHKDLHVKGIWNRSVQQRQGKNYLVTDHKMEMSHVVVKKQNVKMLIADIPFSAIGTGYEGETQALIYKFLKTDIINDSVKEWLNSGDDIEASVRMQYVNVELAMNSQDKRDKEELQAYNKYIGEIANITDFEEEISYFWVVKEAKNISESSLVLAGSNSSTGLLGKEGNAVSTPIFEPAEATQRNLKHLL